MTARWTIGVVLVLALACGGPPPPTPDPTLPGTVANAAVDHALRAALAAKGPGYQPHTRHLDGTGPRFVNRLIRETSPYLLQHAHNPVNWYAWGDEAFARARREGRPIFLSIGYSTCHWCHVMERESFEDEEVARVLNEGFVSIKVDREERPDIDHVYMAAVQAMTGSGGWPMTVILSGDKRPLVAATYMPRAQLIAMLREVEDRWRQDRNAVISKAGEIATQLQAAEMRRQPTSVPPPTAIVDGVRMLAQGFDPIWGGAGARTKFPRPSELDLLLRYHRRTADPSALAHVALTLDRMASGGIRDHVGGGFHRYATDREWRIPHFEKMLYDNAQLAMIYLDAGHAAGRDDFTAIAIEILDYLVRDMTSRDGGLWSATDADSLAPGPKMEAIEGYAFTWTPAEVAAAAGPDAPALSAFYDIAAPGEIDGRNILHTPRSLDEVATQLGTTTDALREQLARGRHALLAARTRRPPPHLDDKILASWNGLAISAFARAALALSRPDYLLAARRAAETVLSKLRGSDGRLRRSFRDGHLGAPGTLDDHAFVIQGLLDLFEATSEPRWLDDAVSIQAQQDAHFLDPVGGYFRTADDAEALLVRDKPLEDGAEPSGNAVAIRNLLRLDLYTEQASFRVHAEQALAAFATDLQIRGAGAPAALSALDMFDDQPLEILLVAKSQASELGALLDVVRHAYVPNRIVVQAIEGRELDELAAKVPSLADKKALNGVATAFVCKRRVCGRPTSDPVELARQLAEVSPLLPDRSPAPLR